MNILSIIPQELKSEPQFFRWLSFSDAAFIIVWFTVLSYPGLLILDERIQAFYFAYNLLVGLILTRKSPFNPKKKLYHTILFALSRDKRVYIPL